jgi:hypothetical protein
MRFSPYLTPRQRHALLEHLIFEPTVEIVEYGCVVCEGNIDAIMAAFSFSRVVFAFVFQYFQYVDYCWGGNY